MYAGLMPKEDPAIIVGHLFRIFDRDNSGSIDFSEFVMATDITSSGSPEEKLRWTFRVNTCATAQYIFRVYHNTDTGYRHNTSILAKNIFDKDYFGIYFDDLIQS